MLFAFIRLSVAGALAAVAAVAAGQNRPVSTLQYDANGNLTSSTDAFGRATGQTYDALNRLKSVTQPKPYPTQSDPIVQFGRDGLDQITSVTTRAA